jgi:integrase
MPRPISIPKLTLHKASGKAVVRLSGIDVYCGVYGTPEAKEKYDREIAEWLARGRTPHSARHTASSEGEKRTGPSVNEVMLAFWRHAQQHYRTLEGKPTSQLSEYRQTIRVVRELYGLEPAATFGPLALKAVREKMVMEKLARTEVNRRVALARRVFKWATGEELVPFDVYQRLTAVAGLQKGRTEAPETDPVTAVDTAHVEATLPVLNRQVRGLIQFMQLTGCRPGEACRLRTCDIDKSGPVWVYRPVHHKNAHRGKTRAITIGPKAQELLAWYPTPFPANYVFSPRRAVEELHAERSKRRETPRYPSHMRRNSQKRTTAPKRSPGERYTTEVIDRAVRRAVERVNKARAASGAETNSPIPYWAPNQIRHSRGTTVRKAYGLEAAQCVLGHERADVTQMYAERDLTLAAKVAGEIG